MPEFNRCKQVRWYLYHGGIRTKRQDQRCRKLPSDRFRSKKTRHSQVLCGKWRWEFSKRDRRYRSGIYGQFTGCPGLFSWNVSSKKLQKCNNLSKGRVRRRLQWHHRTTTFKKSDGDRGHWKTSSIDHWFPRFRKNNGSQKDPDHSPTTIKRREDGSSGNLWCHWNSTVFRRWYQTISPATSNDPESCIPWRRQDADGRRDHISTSWHFISGRIYGI